MSLGELNKKYSHLIRVAIESPFSSLTSNGIEENITYLKKCIRDSLLRGEAPYASHGFFTQPGILDDNIPEERELGIMAGKEWEKSAAYTAVYIDRGCSKGMKLGIELAKIVGRPILYRSLGKDFMTEEGFRFMESLENEGCNIQ